MNEYTPEEIQRAKKQGYFISPGAIQHFRDQAANLGGPRRERDRDAYEAYMQAIKGGLQEAGKTKKDFYKRPMSVRQSALQESLGVNEHGDAMEVEYVPVGEERYKMWNPDEKPSKEAIEAWDKFNWAVENNNKDVRQQAWNELRQLGHTPESMGRLRVTVPAQERNLLDIENQRALWEKHKRQNPPPENRFGAFNRYMQSVNPAV
jgi:hypothetical protein|tara:strand:- start:52 stop:669 length:618 start_codon:yes stop_codon:yes gene_type:complete